MMKTMMIRIAISAKGTSNSTPFSTRPATTKNPNSKCTTKYRYLPINNNINLLLYNYIILVLQLLLLHLNEQSPKETAL